MVESQWVFDATTESFQRDVIDRSEERPVVVDFWAPWCGPCRQLGPMLEALAAEYNGKFLLAKVDVDREQGLAAAFGVQSIPFVVAVRDKQAVDQFLGVLPEAQLREWIQKIVPSRADELLKQGEEQERTDATAAEKTYREALALAPNNDELKTRLARVLAAQNRDEESRAIVAELEKRGFLEPEAEAVKAQLDLRRAAAEAGGLEEARRAAEAAPDDLPLQLKLADALAVAGRYGEALDICLSLIERDKAGIGNEARETMVKIFEMPGTPPDVVAQYRRKLATALY